MGELHQVYLSRPACTLGSMRITTEAIAENIPDWSAADAVDRTGVEFRNWVAENETAVMLTQNAVARLFDRMSGNLPTISAVICSTATPQQATPTIASQVANAFCDRACFSKDWFAFDFNAACSGFVYGLRLAFDILQGDSAQSVLLLTSEVLSPFLDKTDPATAFLFGDASSAVIITKVKTDPQIPCIKVDRPHLQAFPDQKLSIRSPCFHAPGFLELDGALVARAAYKAMIKTLETAAAQHHLSPNDLAAILPHPGSKHILKNIKTFGKIETPLLLHTLCTTGNTASSSIPLAIDQFWDRLALSQRIGLVAFGAGFTSGAVIGEIV